MRSTDCLVPCLTNSLKWPSRKSVSDYARQREKAELLAADGQKFWLRMQARGHRCDGFRVAIYEVLSSGSGEKPTPCSVVRTHYHGTLINGEVFDSSYQRGEPAEFPVNGVIASVGRKRCS